MDDVTQPQSLDQSGQERLRSFIQRIERLEADKAEVMADMKEVYAEAKSMGFDTKIMRQVVRLRKMDQQDRSEQEAVLDLYLHAVGET
ncbi:MULTISPECIES: DUF2312 domain-containing protein [Euryhalocaulis]|uniref:DUF2312 domain-containing protein n=1 Tax=Euryhalocaulis TaxID=1712422 RepID=UPI00039D2711|nr:MULTISPECIES: DUF2312 domain-containing protein [Euryhalocaulis]MBA4801975.1 DUF2312 domain-containing protein [Euryhalocaulis sp.]